MSEPLTAVERRRLRPSVDVAALERWLVATNDDVRVAVIAYFSTDLTLDDIRTIGKVVGATEEDMAMWDTMQDESTELGPLQIPGPDARPDAVAFRSSMSVDPVVWMEPPEDPILASLWSAIEPRR